MLDQFGAFLRSRRERVRPEDVGIAPDGSRRTPGLRREELAELAAISVDYVVRLEQGRLRPSESVLASLSRALLLTPAETEQLATLARPAWGAAAAPGGVRPALLAIVDALDPLPAYVLDACLDVLAFNAAADELFGGISDDANIARLVFTDAEYRARLADPAAVEAEAAGALRLGATREPHNARLRAVVEELRAEPAFGRAVALAGRARQDARPQGVRPRGRRRRARLGTADGARRGRARPDGLRAQHFAGLAAPGARQSVCERSFPRGS
jgi:transcriptional regulator with XRE-family HTH domain